MSHRIRGRLFLATLNQTLLRNHNHISIVDKGTVRLRNPSKDHHDLGKKRPSASAKEKCKKTRPFLFHHNHPQGCPTELEGTKF